MSDQRMILLSVDDAISIDTFLSEALNRWEADGMTNGMLHEALVDLRARLRDKRKERVRQEKEKAMAADDE